MLHTTNYYPGGFAQYVLVPKINVEYGIYKLPDAMSFRGRHIHRHMICQVQRWKDLDFWIPVTSALPQLRSGDYVSLSELLSITRVSH